MSYKSSCSFNQLARMTLALALGMASTSHGLRAAEDGLEIATLERDKAVDFENEVLPILRRNCLACHNVTDAESDLVLETPQTIRTGGLEGPAIVPGNSTESLLLQVAAHNTEPFMPPEDNDVGAKNLTPKELGLLKLWIDQGARGEVKSGSASIRWQPLPPSVNAIFAVAVSPHGNYVAAARANQIFLYHVGTKKQLGRLSDPSLQSRGIYDKPGVAHLDLVQSLAFSPDGQWLASGGFRTVKLWRRHMTPQEMSLSDEETEISAVAGGGAGDGVVVGSTRGTILLLNGSTGSVAKSLSGHEGAVTALALSADGTRLVSAAADKTIRYWNLAEGRELGRLQTPQPTLAVALVKDDTQVAAGGADNVIRIWPLPGAMDVEAENTASDELAKPTMVLAGHTGPITSLATATGSGAAFVSGSQDGQVRVWDIQSGTSIRQMDHGGPVTSVAVRADGQRIASAGENGLAKLWNASDGKLVAEMRGDFRMRLRVEDTRREIELGRRHVANAKGDLEAAEKRQKDEEANVKKEEENLKKAEESFRQKNEAAQKASAEKQTAADELQAAQADLKTQETARTRAEEELQQASDDDRAAAEQAKQAAEKALKQLQERIKVAEEKVKKLTEAAEKANGEKQTAERNAQAAKRSVQRSREAAKTAADAVPVAQTAVQHAEEVVRERDEKLAAQEKAKQEKAVKQAKRPLHAIAFSPRGAELAVAGDGGTIHTFLSENGGPVEVFSQAGHRIVGLSYLRDGRLLAAGHQGSVAIWSTLPAWKLVRTIGSVDSPDELVDRVTALDFSPDGRLLATGGGQPSRSGQLQLWNLSDGQLVREIKEAHSDTVLDVEFSPDGQQIASCGSDRFMKVFDVASGEFVRGFEGHTHHVLGVSWQADGRRLATCGADNVIKVWDALTGDQKKTISGFDKEVTAIQFLGLEERVVISAGNKVVTTRKTSGGGGSNFSGVASFMYTLGCSVDGKIVVAGGHKSVVRVWNHEGKSIVTFPPPRLNIAAEKKVNKET